MTPEQSRNDRLRTRFQGGLVRYGYNALHLAPQLRGRAAVRMTQPHENISPHRDSGSFVFAGFNFNWSISECMGELTLTLDVDEDLLLTR